MSSAYMAAEYKDDAYTIPRSSSVVVKRVYAKPGKGRAAHYLGSAGPSGNGPAQESGAKTAGGGAGGHAWHRGNISKRFDGKEEPPKAEPAKPAVPVSHASCSAACNYQTPPRC